MADGERKPLVDYTASHDSLTNIFNKNHGEKIDAPKVPGIPKRYILTFLGFLGFVTVYALRVNLSVALVDMVTLNETHSVNETLECPGDNATISHFKKGEFQWNPKLQGLILGSFFYGYIFTQVPGGWLAQNYGGKLLFGLGVLGTAVLTILTPVAARSHVGVLITVRIFEGFGEGVTFPAMHAMFGKWAPVWERSRLVAITYAGTQMGTVLASPITGILCDSDILGGWPSVFYIFGGAGCLWFVAWMYLVSDTPAQHKTISKVERDYIEASLGSKPERVRTPWLSIATSMPFWAIFVAHFCNNWGFYTMLTCLPSYLSEVLHFHIQQNGLLSALPYFCSWIVMSSSAFLVDHIRKKAYVTTTQARKLATVVGFVMPAVFLIAAGYAGCNAALDVTFLTLALGLSGFYMSGFNINHLDIAPTFAGTLMGITNCFATVPGFLGPLVVGYFTQDQQTQGQWRKVFFVSASVYVFGALFYLIFASGEIQKWAMPENLIVIIEEPKNKKEPLEKEDDKISQNDGLVQNR